MLHLRRSVIGLVLSLVCILASMGSCAINDGDEPHATSTQPTTLPFQGTTAPGLTTTPTATTTTPVMLSTTCTDSDKFGCNGDTVQTCNVSTHL